MPPLDATANARNLPPLAALRAFDAFGRTGGIRKAAELLGIDHAAVSRQLRALEAFVGAALIDRNAPGHPRLTEEGARYHAAIAAALADIAHETQRLRRRGDTRLSLWCVPGLAFQWLAPRLGSFTDAHPDISLELRPSDTPPDFHGSAVDGDLRYVRDGDAALPDPLRRIELARPPVFPVCSPAFLAAAGDALGTPAALLGLRLLHEESDLEWRLWLQAQGVVPADDALPGPRLWHAHLVLDACRAGRGVALANTLLLGDDLATGRLVRITPDTGPFVPVPLGGYFFTGRRDSWHERRIVAFRHWIAQAIAHSVIGEGGDE